MKRLQTAECRTGLITRGVTRGGQEADCPFGQTKLGRKFAEISQKNQGKSGKIGTKIEVTTLNIEMLGW